MTTNPSRRLRHGLLDIVYSQVAGGVPSIEFVGLDGQRLDALIRSRIDSTLVGTYRYQPYNEHIHIDPDFERLASKVFDEIASLHNSYPLVSVSCADFFFNHVCTIYWDLIINKGSKNLARAFLEEICSIVDRWEKRKRKRVHKGTPYFFLTFVYRQVGDIDSAFASAFRAIQEDKDSLDPVLGSGTYKNSPAYKYASIVDDINNYLYDAVTELRKMLKSYITEFNRTVPYRFAIRKIDIKLFQGNPRLGQIGHFFVYTLECIRKYLMQITTMPANDFYRMKNSRDIFNLCLITDKILEFKYKTEFRQHVPKRDMYMSDGVVLLFEDNQWISQLTSNQRKDPKMHLKISPRLPKNPRDLVDKLIINPINFTCNGRTANDQMRFMLLAYGLRNIGAHELEKQDVFVSEYKKIIKWLLFSTFMAINRL